MFRDVPTHSTTLNFETLNAPPTIATKLFKQQKMRCSVSELVTGAAPNLSFAPPGLSRKLSGLRRKSNENVIEFPSNSSGWLVLPIMYYKCGEARVQLATVDHG